MTSNNKHERTLFDRQTLHNYGNNYKHKHNAIDILHTYQDPVL